MKEILKVYDLSFRQKINVDKTELFYSRNVFSTRFYELKSLLGEMAVNNYVKYLGLPSFIKKRVWKKLKGWKEKIVTSRKGSSHGITQAIAKHVMSCFEIPHNIFGVVRLIRDIHRVK